MPSPTTHFNSEPLDYDNPMPVAPIGPIGPRKFGYVSNFDTNSSACDVWAIASANGSPRFKTFLKTDTPSNLYISSDNAADGAAKSVRCEILNDAGIIEIVDVPLNGQTAVQFASGIDCSRAASIADSGDPLLGNIYINTQAARTGGVPDDLDSILAFIPAGEGTTQQASFRVPLDAVANITNVFIQCTRDAAQAGSAIMRGLVSENGKEPLDLLPIRVSTSTIIQARINFQVGPGGLVRFQVESVSGNDTEIVVNVIYQFRHL